VTVEPGLHSAYVSLSGSISQITVAELNGGGLCVGDAQAGNLSPDLAGLTLPPKPS
jgi:hypothetical protein